MPALCAAVPQSRGDGGDGLAVVEEHADPVLRDERVHRRDGGEGRLGSFLERPRERVGREVVQPGRGDEVAGNGLGVRDGCAVETRTDGRDLAPERPERALEAVEAAAVRYRVGRIGVGKCAGDRASDAIELRHVVPEVRVRVLAVDAEDVGHRHHDAALARRGVLELRHEGVVAEPVLQHDLRVGDRQAVRRTSARRDGGRRSGS